MKTVGLVALSLLGLSSAFPELPRPKDDGKLWVLLAAGSDSYYNYRHQADICHAYQIVKARGVPDEQIIVFMRDDIANSEQNPTKGIIINKPGGPNVYKGVPKDYIKEDLRPDYFLNALAGKSNGDGKKVIKSGPNDKIFIYFADHGAPGFSQFGNSELKATDLLDTIQEMHDNKKYDQMVFYWESCESGSMFNFLNDSLNVFAESAASPYESSYAFYWSKKYDTYLGDLYSINWMENTDKHPDLSTYSLQQQYEVVKNLTAHRRLQKQWVGSHVMEWGDKSITKESLSNFLGSKKVKAQPVDEVQVKSTAVKSREVVKAIAEMKSLVAKDSQELKTSLEEYETIVERRKEMTNDVTDLLTVGFKHMAVDFLENDSLEIPVNEEGFSLQIMKKCYYPIVDAFKNHCYSIGCNDYFTATLQPFADYCEKGYDAKYVLQAIQNICKQPKCGVN